MRLPAPGEADLAKSGQPDHGRDLGLSAVPPQHTPSIPSSATSSILLYAYWPLHLHDRSDLETSNLAAPPREAFEHFQLPRLSNSSIKIVSQLLAFSNNLARARLFNQKAYKGITYLIDFIDVHYQLPEAVV